ncbi:DMT family transporter [Ktedonospora formicarum]|uniref:Membrane protein n=1 Tax=Ktedonospora formicarum TaxID=2778364 RepID=A0A8J3HU12_9CHLR|nr:DMT family transporter [Ktedonospora formicarum]GHO43266.1 membrane protein [Ktedonospora formicarum]
MKLQRADLAIVSASILWGLNYCTVKLLVTSLPPLLVGFLRFLLSALVMLALLRLIEGSIKISWRHLGALIGAGVLGFGFQQIFFLYGSSYAEASMGALIGAFTNAIMTVVASLIARERMTGLMIGGLFAACMGMVLVVTGSGGSLAVTGTNWIGLGLYFGAGILSGLTPLLTHRTLSHYSPLRVTSWMLVVGCAFFVVPGAMSAPSAHLSTLPMLIIPALLFTAIGATGLTNVLWNYGLTRVGVVRLSIYGYLPSIFGVLMSALLLGEVLTTTQWWGTALTIAGVLVSQLKSLDVQALFRKALLKQRTARRESVLVLNSGTMKK